MLCLDKEDELKICKKYSYPKFENNKILDHKHPSNENVNSNIEGSNTDPKGNSSRNFDNIDDKIRNTNINDNIIYINTSTCNSFIYVATKFCLYVFDNDDFRFVNFYALDYKNAYKKYGCHDNVFLSPFDNTVYIITDNFKYVYVYNIVNKKNIVMLDNDKNIHSININDNSDFDTSSENENEYYEYITYIKNIYRKKIKEINTIASIKLITVLYLPIPSNCLIITKHNILFFSYETDEIFISDNIQTVLDNTKKLNRQNEVTDVKKIIANTKIVRLESIYYRRNKKKPSLKTSAIKNVKVTNGDKKKNEKKRNNSGDNSKDDESSLRGIQNVGLIKMDKGKYMYKNIKPRVFFFFKNQKMINKCFRNFPFYRNALNFCNKIRRNIILKENKREIKKRKRKGAHSKKKQLPTYLYSNNKENNLKKFIKKKNISIQIKNNKYKKCINIKGVERVEFSIHNDYLLLISRTHDFYIFSFFHKFFNVPQDKNCYYYGRSIHKNEVIGTIENKYRIQRQNLSNLSNKNKNIRNNRMSNVLKKKRKDDQIIGMYVDSSVLDISINIYRKIILIIYKNYIIKAYSINPYICKHVFKKCVFTIDKFSGYKNTCYYYNFLVWNRQNNFFLVSFNQNNFHIFNTNGTLYHSENKSFDDLSSTNPEGNNNMPNSNNTSGVILDNLNNNQLGFNKLSTYENKRTKHKQTENVLLHRKKKYINISFVFNDFKLFCSTRSDESYYYINVKNLIYLNDIYSQNKIFHYNSNYYTNEYKKNIFIGLNNLVIFDTNINNYNINDHEKNIINIKEVNTPFKFIKKAYLNFNNTYILVIFKTISIYNVKTRKFSQFVDDNLFKFFFHNYPCGWLFDDVFFATCLHNKYDENNFKNFKIVHQNNVRRESIFFSQSASKDNDFSFDLFKMDYESEEINEIDDRGTNRWIDKNEDSESKRSESDENEDDEEDEWNENGTSLNTDGSVDEYKENFQKGGTNPQNFFLLNYLFNYNHDDSDLYYKFFEEYFNNNKGNIYSKPYCSFYNNFFLEKSTNIFLEKFKEKQIKNYKYNTFTEMTQNNSIQPKNKLHKEDNVGSRKSDSNLEKNDDNICLNNKESINNHIDKHETQYKNTYFDESNKFTSINNVEEHTRFININEENRKNIDKKYTQLNDEYQEILNTNNFYYIIYLYNINNNMKLTNYVCSIKLLYRPILTHVFCGKGIQQEDRQKKEMKAQNEKLMNISLRENYIIILDAFYNLICFKIIEEKNNNDPNKLEYSMRSEIVFVLPLNKDNNFAEPSSFYALFDIYNYVFHNYDNSIVFLHIYKSNIHNNSSHNNDNDFYDFEFAYVYDKKVEYLQVIRNNNNLVNCSLPTPIKYIWPHPFYYIYLFYYYIAYTVYNINRINMKLVRHRLALSDLSKEQKYYPNGNLLKRINNYEILFNNNSYKSDQTDESNEASIPKENKTSLKKKKNIEETDNYSKNDDKFYNTFENVDDSFKFDFFSLKTLDNNIRNERYNFFEKLLKSKLNEHSENYSNLICLKKKKNNEKMNCWISSIRDVPTYMNNFNYIFNKLFLFYNSCEEMEKSIYYTNQQGQVNYSFSNDSGLKCEEDEYYSKHCNKWNKTHSILEKTFCSLFFSHMLSKNKNKLNKIGEQILKYNLYSIMDEVNSNESSCYLFCGIKNSMDAISISKCSNKFCLVINLLKNSQYFESNKYTNANLIIYRHIMLNRIPNDTTNNSIIHFHHIINCVGLFVNIISNQLSNECINNKEENVEADENKKKRDKEVTTQNFNSFIFDKISFKINTYINIILFKFFKLYSDVYSYSSKKYQIIYQGNFKEKKKKNLSLIVKTLVNYMENNICVINILEIILYECINTLNDFYVTAYKIVYNLINNINTDYPYYNQIITKDKRKTILNIVIIILYTLFLSNSYKKKKKAKDLLNIILNTLHQRSSVFFSSFEQEDSYNNFYINCVYRKTLHSNGTKKEDKNNELRNKHMENADFSDFVNKLKPSMLLNYATKIKDFKGNIKDKHIHFMILYFIKMVNKLDILSINNKKIEDTIKEDYEHANSIEDRQKHNMFEIKSDYAYKMNCNVYYIALYLLCILKKKHVFLLYTILKILRKYFSSHISEVVINILRKMDPYVSAIIIYSLGNFTPHDFMQLCISKNKRYNICSLYMVNVQNYVGIYDIRKFYCMYFLCTSLRSNINYSINLIHYMSILFSELNRNKDNNILYWNYFGLDKTNLINILNKQTGNNLDNYIFFLLCSFNLNTIKYEKPIDIYQLQYLFDQSYKMQALKNAKRNNSSNKNGQKSEDSDKDIHTPNNMLEDKNASSKHSNYFIYNKDRIFQTSKFSQLKIKPFSINNFKMNKIIYEFFYNIDIIQFSKDNINNFSNLYKFNSSLLSFPSYNNDNLSKSSDTNYIKNYIKEKNKLNEIDNVKKSVDYLQVQNIYIRFVILIQNIICYYINNMLWYELYYFATYIKIDIVSFFSHIYFFKSIFFSNFFWGICPIDVAHNSLKNSQFSFLNLNEENVLTEKNNKSKICTSKNCSDSSLNLKKIMNPSNSDEKKIFSTKCFESAENVSTFQKEESSKKDNKLNIQSNDQNAKKNKKDSIYVNTKNELNKANDDTSNVENTNYHINYTEYARYTEYMNNLKTVFEKIEYENESINKTFFNDNFKAINFMDIYKSFKNHFNIDCLKKKKKKNMQKKQESVDLNELHFKKKTRIELENKRYKYRNNIHTYNIYNKLTDYTFLETYFAPSAYKYIPINNTLKYLFYFFNVSNINNKSCSKKYIKYIMKRRIYEYITNNIIDISKKKKNERFSPNKYKNKYSLTQKCSIYKNDIIWFLLRLFILLKLPIHALALTIYCKNYVILNILLNIFPYLYHIINYILNMNGSHFLYKKRQNNNNNCENIKSSEYETPYFSTLVDEQLNKKLCDYCYNSILHYKCKTITPFSNDLCDEIHKKKKSTSERNQTLYDHYMSCECLTILIFLRKKLISLRKTI
ncbi:conserved Plasmodium protein, unknown function [Plasmodium berghei]|uniref:Uncharacterized protein n=2 Tax=Plasmodium berghei TaxID=5821 RepID=A0A509AND7_PLABA|nr:conserved Plasmodium protein, unknown function [Plasmodium berghei ANKA]SCL96762.1 conserved Plasmodium protein, unknown function [Plasmodium berghei]SCM16486.1 conserved Plasmodium protein, unknown function [Plasmodium berghei]SCM18280.1 conserved Plasmodium protein, unknown function [Plasmodium berghei]VUC57592.1 conserved Plasmodium protein, unknown function [Plasmodium berghei ANKA]|eukprot:XP_034423363.1 conserved Plasmodium protein, unknown function [Plasmodium berghei ANKA]